MGKGQRAKGKGLPSPAVGRGVGGEGHSYRRLPAASRPLRTTDYGHGLRRTIVLGLSFRSSDDEQRAAGKRQG